MSDYLTREYDWDDPDLVSAYDELPLWAAMFGVVLLKHMPLRPNITVLDLGCGTGFPLLELAQRLGSSCRVVGLDLWRAGLARAKRKVRILHTQNATLVEGDGHTIPFDSSTFDLIVSNLGINNLRDAETALRECCRVARPNAHIALTTNVQGHMHEFYRVYEQTLRELGKLTALDRLRDHIGHRTTRGELCRTLDKVGFTIQAVHQDEFSMRYLDGSALLRHSFIQIGFLDGWRSILTAQEEKGVFQRLENNLNHLAEQGRRGLDMTIPLLYVEAQKIA